MTVTAAFSVGTVLSFGIGAYLVFWHRSRNKLKSKIPIISPEPQVIDPYCLPDQSSGPRDEMLVLHHVQANSTCLWDALHGALIDAEILQTSDEDPEIMKQCMGYMKETPQQQDEESEGSVVPKFKEEYRNLKFIMTDTLKDVDSFYQVFVFVFCCFPIFRNY